MKVTSIIRYTKICDSIPFTARKGPSDRAISVFQLTHFFLWSKSLREMQPFKKMESRICSNNRFHFFGSTKHFATLVPIFSFSLFAFYFTCYSLRYCNSQNRYLVFKPNNVENNTTRRTNLFFKGTENKLLYINYYI